MATVRVLVGLPGSGKSTYANELRKIGWMVNSSDAIREELYGTADEQSHNDEIFNTMYRRTVNGIVADLDVVYDATNVSSKRRAALLKSFKSNKAIPKDTRYEVVVIATPYTECLKRNLARERHVPAKVILSMMKRFEMPAEWEGWDEIRVYGNDNPRGIEKFQELMKAAETMEQDNPYHTLTVGRHMEAAATGYYHDYARGDFDKNTFLAISYHDLGKIYCKTFYNMRGEKTDIAHFYNHENVGAYLYLSLMGVADLNGKLREDDFEIVQLIQHHMACFKGEKYLNKVKERFGEEFYNKLNVVHKYDTAAH